MKEITLNHQQIHTGSLILVNTEYPYQSIKNEPMLPVFDAFPSIKLQHRAGALLASLFDVLHCRSMIVPVSGWRSHTEQQQIWQDTITEHGLEYTQKYVAIPGHSEHETGLAIDLALKQDTIDFICPEFPYHGICQQFRQRCADFGFIERYPAGKEPITKIGHEPWHFRYVGIPHAKIIQSHGFTLEEYHDFIKRFCFGKSAYHQQCGHLDVFVSYLNAHANLTYLKINSQFPYSFSGNNSDGFIITEWRYPYGHSNKLRNA